jgi:hypothetical protein
MASLLMIMRRLLLLGVAFGALGLHSGCQGGFGGGEPLGIRSFTNGELTGNVPGPLDAATAAVMQELVAMGVLNAEERRHEGGLAIEARTLEEVPLQIQVNRLSDNATQLVIQVGPAHEQQARGLFTRVRNRLQAQFN